VGEPGARASANRLRSPVLACAEGVQFISGGPYTDRAVAALGPLCFQLRGRLVRITAVSGRRFPRAQGWSSVLGVPKSDRVGLVIAGAGARGAYEAGALAALLPRLQEAGALPRVLLGTSAGSINAAYLAAKLHLGAERASDGLVALWRSLDKRELMGWLGATALPTLIGYGGRILCLPTGSGSLATFGRFPHVLEEAIAGWEQIQANLDAGIFDAVGVVATAAATGGSVVFLQAGKHVSLPPFDAVNGIHYAPTRLSTDHVLASCSIPVAFPPREVHEPAEVRGWYWDGGTRLNTPISPALAIGVGRVVIVSTGPSHHPSPTADDSPASKPDFDDAILHLVQATLDDPLIEDLHSFVRVNRLVAASGKPTLDDREAYEYMFAGPDRQGVLGRAAAEVLRTRFGGPLRAWSDFAVLNRLLGRQGAQQAELQSYLLFDSGFLDRLVDMGHDDGEKAWRRGWLRDELPPG
jgi:NTE family protein